MQLHFVNYYTYIKMYYAALYCIENVHYTEFRANDASANIIVRGAQQITRSDTLAIRTLVWFVTM